MRSAYIHKLKEHRKKLRDLRKAIELYCIKEKVLKELQRLKI